MVLQFYGSPSSTCSLRVAMVLYEKKVPFEFFPIDLLKGEQKTAEFVKHQPFGQVPYINDDGFILFESRAICRYIAAKYASQGTSGLLPADVKANALFEQAASIESSNFDPSASGAVSERIFKVVRGLQPDEAKYAAHIETLDAKLNGYETILSKQKYLAGEEITLADLFHIPYGNLLAVSGSDVITRKPNVARWWKDLISRQTWLAVKDGVKTTTEY